MNPTRPPFDSAAPDVATYPLLAALRERRSRRFGLGMKIPAGPLAFTSRHAPVPLSEAEEALLAFAACGVTGHALADLCFERGEGGNILGGLVGRTLASGDALQSVTLAVINDQTTWLLRRPRDLPAGEAAQHLELSRNGEFTELYRRSRVKLQEGRAAPPTEPLFNLNLNRWAAHAPGTTCFLPINDVTLLYLNGLLEVFNETTGAFVLDERNHFLPAGVGRFARSRGGHLDDDPHHGRVVTVRQVEQFVTEFLNIEQGMLLQNLALMTQALGLGGYPNFANHEFGWFQALGFQLNRMPASRYVGAGPLVSLAMKLLRRDPPVPYPVGLERNGELLLKPFCPPHYASMADAVRAVVALKFGPQGIYRSEAYGSGWRQHREVTGQVPAISEATISATIAYCEYLWRRYGRFPVYLPPYRTTMAFQAGHLDGEFYARFYRPEALGETQRADIARTQGGPA